MFPIEIGFPQKAYYLYNLQVRAIELQPENQRAMQG